MALAVEKEAPAIMAANKLDLQHAEKQGVAEAMLQRLAVTEKTIREICEGLRQVASLDDPVGGVMAEWARPRWSL